MTGCEACGTHNVAEDPTFRLADDVHHGDCHVRLGFRQAREAIVASRAVRPPMRGDDDDPV